MMLVDKNQRTPTDPTRVSLEDEWEASSPPLADVRARSYEVVTRVYSSPEKKQVLGVHTQVCQALLDQRELGPQFR